MAGENGRPFLFLWRFGVVHIPIRGLVPALSRDLVRCGLMKADQFGVDDGYE